MMSRQRENAIESLKESMGKAEQTLHLLTKRRKEVSAMIREKDRDTTDSFNKDVNKLRETERNKRLKLYGEIETQRQHVTSALIMELFKICREENVPQYVYGIAKVLDNFQGVYNLIVVMSMLIFISFREILHRTLFFLSKLLIVRITA